MRALVAALLVAAGVAVPAGAAAPPVHIPGAGSLTAQATPSRAGARPAQLQLSVRAELQCGRVGPAPIVVTLPAAERLPGALAAASVRVNGAAPTRVVVRGKVVTISPPVQPKIICDVIGPGTIKVVFMPAARLGNPVRAGAYRVTMHARGETASGSFAVS